MSKKTAEPTLPFEYTPAQTYEEIIALLDRHRMACDEKSKLFTAWQGVRMVGEEDTLADIARNARQADLTRLVKGIEEEVDTLAQRLVGVKVRINGSVTTDYQEFVSRGGPGVLGGCYEPRKRGLELEGSVQTITEVSVKPEGMPPKPLVVRCYFVYAQNTKYYFSHPNYFMADPLKKVTVEFL